MPIFPIRERDLRRDVHKSPKFGEQSREVRALQQAGFSVSSSSGSAAANSRASSIRRCWTRSTAASYAASSAALVDGEGLVVTVFKGVGRLGHQDCGGGAGHGFPPSRAGNGRPRVKRAGGRWRRRARRRCAGRSARRRRPGAAGACRPGHFEAGEKVPRGCCGAGRGIQAGPAGRRQAAPTMASRSCAPAAAASSIA